MTIFLIKVVLLYLVGLYWSLRVGTYLHHPLRQVEYLFVGAGRPCKGIHGQNKSPALALMPYEFLAIIRCLITPFPKTKPADLLM
jgi:hypothetical protein